jgi:hypothetical protein
VLQSASSWEAVLKWQLTVRSRLIWQGQRIGQAAAQPAAPAQPATNAAALPVVSITGAMRTTEKMVDGTRRAQKQLPHLYINGDYICTRRRVNDFPVYVKIHGQQCLLSEREPFNIPNSRICIQRNAADGRWCIKLSASPYNNSMIAFLILPAEHAEHDLIDIQSQLRIEVDGHPEASVCIKTMTDTIESIAETADTHVNRKLLLDEWFSYAVCNEEQPFSDFVVIECGPAMVC